jgi:hypothetical protein
MPTLSPSSTNAPGRRSPSRTTTSAATSPSISKSSRRARLPSSSGAPRQRSTAQPSSPASTSSASAFTRPTTATFALSSITASAAPTATPSSPSRLPGTASCGASVTRAKSSLARVVADSRFANISGGCFCFAAPRIGVTALRTGAVPPAGTDAAVDVEAARLGAHGDDLRLAGPLPRFGGVDAGAGGRLFDGEFAL